MCRMNLISSQRKCEDVEKLPLCVFVMFPTPNFSLQFSLIIVVTAEVGKQKIKPLCWDSNPMESNGSLFRLIKRQKLSLVTYLRTNCNIAQSHDGKATFLKAGYPYISRTNIY